DPGKLPGFSPLNRVPLQTYYPPTVTGATLRSRRLLHHRALGPTMNLGGYLTQPPLMLTTIKAAAQMESKARYKGGHPKAPISSIRVRVKGVTGLNALSEARIKTVALAIRQSTGLQVQVTTGSSPTPIAVNLPPGKYGRPALKVTQDWVKQGAVVHLVSSIDAESLGLFVLVLVAAALLLANGITASIRARRTELGVLAALGWSPAELGRAVLVEVVGIAGLAGVLGVGVAAALVVGLGLHLALLDTLLVVPIALAVALVAAWRPVRAASRTDPRVTLSPPVTARGYHRARRLRHLAFGALARRPGRSAVGVVGLALGVVAITVLVAIELRFQGQVTQTLIGQVAILRAQGADLAAAALVAALGAASVADVVSLDLAERAGEWAALAATGWSRGELVRLGGLQGLLLGGLGSLAGAVVGFALGSVLTGDPGFVVLTALVALGGGLVLTVVAIVIPVLGLARREPASVLAGE
ncbi:MAG: FtsX-like permease family protein, partial [Acidimicrobiales bacterium]